MYSLHKLYHIFVIRLSVDTLVDFLLIRPPDDGRDVLCFNVRAVLMTHTL